MAKKHTEKFKKIAVQRLKLTRKEKAEEGEIKRIIVGILR